MNISVDSMVMMNINCTYVKHKWLLPKFYIGSVAATIIAIVGIFGNITTVIILATPKMRTANNLYLTFLAVFDLLLLITAVLLYPSEYFIEYTDSSRLYTFWTSYVRYVYTASHTSQTASVYTTIAVTVERCIVTVQPRLAASTYVCSAPGSLVVIGLVSGFAVAFNLPRYWELSVTEVPQCRGFGSRKLEMGELLLNDTYATVFGLWVTSTVMVFAPFLLLLVFNGIIVQTIRRPRHNCIKPGGVDGGKEKTKNATVVLVVIVIIFLVCNVWGFVTSLLEYVVGFEQLYRNNEKFYSFSREAINLLAIINASLNFFIYVIFGKDFRRDVVRLYHCDRLQQFSPLFNNRNQVAIELADNLDILNSFDCRCQTEDTSIGGMRETFIGKLSAAAQLQPTDFLLINSQENNLSDVEDDSQPFIQAGANEMATGQSAVGKLFVESLIGIQLKDKSSRSSLNLDRKISYGTQVDDGSLMVP